MNLNDIFTEEEAILIKKVYSPRNGNIVFGTAFRLDFFDRLGLFEESRQHFSREFGHTLLERTYAIDFLKRELARQRVIELGPGPFGTMNGVLDFAALGVSEYTAVEPVLTEKYATETNEHFRNGPATIGVVYANPRRWEKIAIPVSVEATDGLSYLLSQPDESAVVYSSCVFREDALTDVGLPQELSLKYLHHLINQIYRVTPRNGITIHSDNTPYIMWDKHFQELGFKLVILGTSKRPEANGIAVTEQTELSYVLGAGGVILRK